MRLISHIFAEAHSQYITALLKKKVHILEFDDKIVMENRS